MQMLDRRCLAIFSLLYKDQCPAVEIKKKNQLYDKVERLIKKTDLGFTGYIFKNELLMQPHRNFWLQDHLFVLLLFLIVNKSKFHPLLNEL